MPTEPRSPWFAAIVCAVLAAIVAVALSLGVGALSAAPGPQGADGSPGVDGRDGAAGQDGATGPTGAEGSAGAEGPSGAAGIPGASGNNGIDGQDGIDGTNGAPGADGADGADGANGADAVVAYAEAEQVDGTLVQSGSTYSSTAMLSLATSVDQGQNYVLLFSASRITYDVGQDKVDLPINCDVSGPAVMTSGGSFNIVTFPKGSPRSFSIGELSSSLASIWTVSVTRVIAVTGTSGNVGVTCSVAYTRPGPSNSDPNLVLHEPTIVLMRAG